MRRTGLAVLLTFLVGCSRPVAPAPNGRTLLDRLIPSALGAAVNNAQPRGVDRPTVRAKVVQLEAVTVNSLEIPLDNVSDAQLRQLAAQDLPGVGSVSLGRPNRGRLRNAVALPDRPFWRILNPKRSWATEETAQGLEAAVQRVWASEPGTPALFIGDLSGSKGGYVRPHRSHQSGRDADVGYYYLSDHKWYTKANAENLDCRRTWLLLKAFMSEADVELVFMDRSVQELLRAHALQAGEDPAFLETVFQRSKRDETVVRHEYGHLTHFHVRFYSSRATRGFEKMRERLGPRLRF
ncbi:MAG: penicillin-insensitive murein endopeptidase [Polyangiaceae bacterium]|nr:penicillin-insensitive murein endopeptidase [Polyangiaceae bacterium]